MFILYFFVGLFFFCFVVQQNIKTKSLVFSYKLGYDTPFDIFSTVIELL